MDYGKHYHLLMKRAKERSLTEYYEAHHITPRCMGGGDEKENLVNLTPEEHYTAHQLLVKMFPENEKLVYAALLMTRHPVSKKRANNKVYGWLKRRYSEVCKQRIGEKNGSFGSFWVTNSVAEMKIKNVSEMPNGWRRGRKDRKKQKPKSDRKMFFENLEGKEYEILFRYESGESIDALSKEYGWKNNRSLIQYLNRKFPFRKKFAPREKRTPQSYNGYYGSVV